MRISHALRTIAVTSTAALALTTAPAGADMPESMVTEATARLQQLAAHVDAWHAQHPGQTYTEAQLHAAFPQQAKAPGVIWHFMGTAAPGYCLVTVDATATDSPTTMTPADSRFYDSTTKQVFVPSADLLQGKDAGPGACAAWTRARLESAPIVWPPAPTPTPPVPAVDQAKVRAALVADVKAAGALVRKVQRKRPAAKPTLKALRKAGLRPANGNALTLRYGAKARSYCVRAVHADDGLAGRKAVWWDAGLRKAVTGKRPAGARSSCAKVF